MNKPAIPLKKNLSQSLVCYLLPTVPIMSYFFYYLFTKSFDKPIGYYLIHYLYTYNHGFVARGLVGEVISWFFDKVDDNVTLGVTILFSFLLCAGASLFIGKILNKTKENKELFQMAVVLSVVICLSPYFLRYYITDYKLDTVLWALSLLAICLCDRKYGIIFVPALCILCTFINPVFLFCSMIPVSIILLYKYFNSENKVKNGIICSVSYISMIGFGIFAVLSEKHLGFENARQMVDYYFSRYTGTAAIDYYGFENEWLLDYFESPKVIVQKIIEVYFSEWTFGKETILFTLFLGIPLLAGLFFFWYKALKKEKDKFQKFILFLCAISPVTIIPPILVSWEASKYVGNSLMIQLVLMLYFISEKKESVLSVIKELTESVKKNKISLICVLLYYAFLLA